LREIIDFLADRVIEGEWKLDIGEEANAGIPFSGRYLIHVKSIPFIVHYGSAARVVEILLADGGWS
jgi:hypothetical protein